MITFRTVNAWDECTSLKTALIKCTMIFLLFHYFLLLSQVNFGLFVILLRVVFGKLAVTYSQEHIKRARCLWVCPWYDFSVSALSFQFFSSLQKRYAKHCGVASLAGCHLHAGIFHQLSHSGGILIHPVKFNTGLAFRILGPLQHFFSTYRALSKIWVFHNCEK